MAKAVKMELIGLRRLIDKLRSEAARARKDWDVSVAVGYSTNYAIHVHENMAAYHPNGQAKYLEQPARQLTNNGTLADIVAKAVVAGKTPAQALLLAGLRVQRESQQLVPVDTGALKNSAFTTLEGR